MRRTSRTSTSPTMRLRVRLARLPWLAAVVPAALAGREQTTIAVAVAEDVRDRAVVVVAADRAATSKLLRENQRAVLCGVAFWFVRLRFV